MILVITESLKMGVIFENTLGVSISCLNLGRRDCLVFQILKDFLQTFLLLFACILNVTGFS